MNLYSNFRFRILNLKMKKKQEENIDEFAFKLMRKV